MRDALGEHVFDHYLEAKRAEWRSYAGSVHQWEIDRYLEIV
jgi:glutamine synthetase